MTDLEVVYISGAPRSGTTLLGMALGQLPECCDVGELWALWRPAFREGDLCGCGKPVHSCGFWLEVAQRSLGPDYETRGPALGRLHRETMGTLSAPKVWAHVSGRRRNPAFTEYAEALGREYRAIAEASGARVVIDSSKMASDALLAGSIPGINLKVIHLIRDPRGVAWSWRKQMRQPGPQGRAMHRQRPIATAARWDAYNAFAELLLAPRLGGHFRRLRYEDLLDDPRGQLSDLARWIGADPADLPVSGQPPRLTLEKPTHPVWGNPVRTSSGTITLREDEEWRNRMPAAERMMATVATLPFLWRYRYPAFGVRDRPRTP
jgi:hypothetical protein